MSAYPGLDLDRAAIALHHAINALHATPGYHAKLSAWSAYIHVGP
jgi:hypothetical protein